MFFFAPKIVEMCQSYCAMVQRIRNWLNRLIKIDIDTKRLQCEWLFSHRLVQWYYTYNLLKQTWLGLYTGFMLQSRQYMFSICLKEIYLLELKVYVFPGKILIEIFIWLRTQYANLTWTHVSQHIYTDIFPSHVSYVCIYQLETLIKLKKKNVNEKTSQRFYRTALESI